MGLRFISMVDSSYIITVLHTALAQQNILSFCRTIVHRLVSVVTWRHSWIFISISIFIDWVLASSCESLFFQQTASPSEYQRSFLLILYFKVCYNLCSYSKRDLHVDHEFLQGHFCPSTCMVAHKIFSCDREFPACSLRFISPGRRADTLLYFSSMLNSNEWSIVMNHSARSHLGVVHFIVKLDNFSARPYGCWETSGCLI